MLELRPTIIRGNASEIIALAGGTSRGQGVDSRDPVELAEESAALLARKYRTVVAVTGATDFVTDGEESSAFEGGSAIDAAGHRARLCINLPCRCIRGDKARRIHLARQSRRLPRLASPANGRGREAVGPSSFSWRFLDALAALDEQAIDREARIIPA